MGLRRLLVVAALVAGSTGLAVPSSGAPGGCGRAGAALTALGLHAGAQAAGVVVWSGHVPSWDGLPLDVDVTLPGSGSGGPACPLPLVALAHGWGNSKSDWESPAATSASANKSHWNNVWFGSRGYAALTWTARGWHGSCGPDSSSDPLHSPAGLPPSCTAGGRQYWVHLDDLRYEIRDAQWLMGRLVDAGVADPAGIGVTGGSYGGGVAWLSALANDRTMCGGTGWDAANGPDPCAGRANGALVPWRSPKGVPLHVAAAVPEYTWGSLALALMPNGRASDGRPGAPPSGSLTDPIGVPIESYVTGLFVDGYTPPAVENGFYQPPTSSDQTSNLPLWFALVQAGVNTVTASVPATKAMVANALDQLEHYKSPLSSLLPVDAKVPVLMVQGLTDPLFTPMHAQLLWQKVKAFAPDYPMGLVLADVGHSYATNPPDVWAAFNQRANAFLDHELRGVGPAPALDVEAQLTRCRPGQLKDPLTTLSSPPSPRAPALPALAHGTLTLSVESGGVVTNAPLGIEGLATDPIANGGASIPGPFGAGCRTIPVATDPGVVAWTFPLGSAVTLAGQPLVRLAVQPTSPDAELAARLWDVAPDGTQTLMARGVYRLAGTPVAPAGDVGFELSANAWRLPAGDQLKLEVAGADAPYFQPDTVPSATAISSVDLELPLAEGAPQPAQVASAAPSRAGGPGASAPAELAATGAPAWWPLTACALLLAAFGLRRRSAAG